MSPDATDTAGATATASADATATATATATDTGTGTGTDAVDAANAAFAAEARGAGTPGRYDLCPWQFFGSASEEELREQAEWRQRLVQRLAGHGGEAVLDERTFVSPWAGVFTDRLHLGERSYIAAHAYVTDDVELGRNCTINPYATVRGKVRAGDGVRIGAHSSVLGFNHSIAPDRPVHKQPLASTGIVIGDDVWIGSNVVVVDGVTIGDHCVIGAGAVVTKDLPPWSIAAGNPARRIRDRREGGTGRTGRTDGPGLAGGPGPADGVSARTGAGAAAPAHEAAGTATAVGAGRVEHTNRTVATSLDTQPSRFADTDTDASAGTDAGTGAGTGADAGAGGGTDAGAGERANRAIATSLDSRLARFAGRAREQAAQLLERCREEDTEGRPAFVDRPGAPRTVRAVCDAVEIAQLLLGTPPPGSSGEDLTAYLRGLQDPETGLVPELGNDPGSATGAEPPAERPTLDDDTAMYHILCVGYALDLLGSRFEHPVRAVHALRPEELRTRLDRLPWRTQAWRSGHWVDGVGTAILRNIEGFGLRTESAETLFGWLLVNADPGHGLYGRPGATDRWLQPVNGFYRLARGTFAQFGLPVPYPERVVDTVLAHARDSAFFGPDRGTACNVLDVIHPLWLCARQTGHRRTEGQDWARRQLLRLLDRWQDGQGFGFALEPGGTRDRTPGLQGTEMWLAITWLLADHLGISGALGYRPDGVHRPAPARIGLD
ncbi:acyltransferase [Streptomyces pathocidini]|uniref:acyltransferase n=1 Tax=Streptomyces pathocidini TaxID=1650571 RepID=UPI0033C64FE3